LLFSYMFTHPGTKLVFMGGEFGQTAEWNHDRSLDWYLTQFDFHKGIQTLFKELNRLYKSENALFHFPFDNRGFEWVDYSDRENSVIIFMRKSEKKEEALIVICNFTPESRHGYRVGVPYRGTWIEIFNSDKTLYGGSGQENSGLLYTSPVKYHGKDYSVTLTLSPLSLSILKLQEEMAEFEIE
jgi:1,4-alpha-glucan branching enzyme